MLAGGWGVKRDYRKLWVIEERTGRSKKWVILPNTVHLTKLHCQWDIERLRVDYPDDEYRIIVYVPEVR